MLAKIIITDSKREIIVELNPGKELRDLRFALEDLEEEGEISIVENFQPYTVKTAIKQVNGIIYGFEKDC